MGFCTQCGKQASEEDKFCSGCGRSLSSVDLPLISSALPLTPAAKKNILLAAIALLLVFFGIALHSMISSKPAPVTSVQYLPATAPSPTTQQPATNTTPAADSQPQTTPSQPQPEQRPEPKPSPSTPAVAAPSSGMDMQAVQDMLAKVGKTVTGADSKPAEPTKPSPPASSDRYPNSQPISVDDVAIPNVGLPISRQAYTTLDSV